MFPYILFCFSFLLFHWWWFFFILFLLLLLGISNSNGRKKKKEKNLLLHNSNSLIQHTQELIRSFIEMQVKVFFFFLVLCNFKLKESLFDSIQSFKFRSNFTYLFIFIFSRRRLKCDKMQEKYSTWSNFFFPNTFRYSKQFHGDFKQQ